VVCDFQWFWRKLCKSNATAWDRSQIVANIDANGEKRTGKVASRVSQRLAFKHSTPTISSWYQLSVSSIELQVIRQGPNLPPFRLFPKLAPQSTLLVQKETIDMSDRAVGLLEGMQDINTLSNPCALLISTAEADILTSGCFVLIS
jgi:hypothetical protein